ncbi:MAG: rod shape-determining protein MreC [Bacteroidales bacterium]|uniref:rod shape-determining protein MreC n=1 Tax=Porphyromonas sp. TaxID=1924944 RepID=UPI002A813AF8|nr:rod shape-determining protein MreC [Porphyromonas sp.]MDD6929029.1 rod shape-determining protein MreC [Bacteroidales bacterium]MDY4245166.1 rod shape-determining protein MreC [Porphyromonas sp.]
MRRLLELLRANLHWVLLVVCEAIALLLLFHGSLYHSFVGAAASSSVVGRIHTEGARWRSYLSLQQENQQLTVQLATLEGRYLSLQRQFEYLLADTVVPQVLTPLDSLDTLVREDPSFTFVTARVVSLTYLKANNMMTIDRGARDGIKPNMGVVSQSGVVGIVAQVGPRYATVVPLINESLTLSCMTLREGHVGDLSWRQKLSPTEGIVRGLPKHAHLAVGDTLVTSGYSAIFPPGMMIGRLEGEGAEGTPLTYRKELPVLLATDFGQLHHVYVITGGDAINLEEQERKEDL